MKFLFVSHDALAVDLAWKVKREGHDVLFAVGAKSEKDIGDGLLDKCDDWEAKADWADVVVFDDVGRAGDAEKLRKRGKSVVGGNAYGDRLELARAEPAPVVGSGGTLQGSTAHRELRLEPGVPLVRRRLR